MTGDGEDFETLRLGRENNQVNQVNQVNQGSDIKGSDRRVYEARDFSASSLPILRASRLNSSVPLGTESITAFSSDS